MASQGSTTELRDHWVHFRICDITIPEPMQVLTEFYGRNLLQGRVMEVSSNNGDMYAVVEVEGIATPVIVSLERILGVL